uniref:Uncharacterized protein n=1 Tax=Globodera rostochiensis TaxID=31243 RepID=A0A914GV40_GLORO
MLKRIFGPLISPNSLPFIMLPAKMIWENDAYDRWNDFNVALIIVICAIGFVLIACITAAIWFTMAQRNRKAQIPRNLSPMDGRAGPYVGRPVEPKVEEEGRLVTDKGEQDKVYRELTKPGRIITSV